MHSRRRRRRWRRSRSRNCQEIGSDIGRNLYICTEGDRKFIHFALAMLGDRVSEIELRPCLRELAHHLVQASEFRPFLAMVNFCLPLLLPWCWADKEQFAQKRDNSVRKRNLLWILKLYTLCSTCPAPFHTHAHKHTYTHTHKCKKALTSVLGSLISFQLWYSVLCFYCQTRVGDNFAGSAWKVRGRRKL